MAQTKKSKNPTEKSWLVEVNNNPQYCGIGAGGVQFAYGKAIVKSERMARWFKEHDGYTVTETDAGDPEEVDATSTQNGNSEQMGKEV